MSLTAGEFFKTLQGFTGRKLNPEQKEAVIYTDGPLKISAGPGSGKTEVVVAKALYLILVKGISPRSIFLVTFTRKASEEFFSRFVSYAGKFREKFPRISFEPYDIYAGTLHSLALRVMEEFQYSKFQDYKVLGDFEREFFIFKNFQDLRSSESYREVFRRFERDDFSEEERFLRRISVASKLFEFIPQNFPSRGGKRSVKKPKDITREIAWEETLELYLRYKRTLKEKKRLDYVHLEELFLQFLNSDEAKVFLEGDGSEFFPGIEWVIVDEYQDTNPLDEAIYFKLASKTKKIAVVGDENQALYRFRGALVDCFIDFESRIRKALNVSNVKVVRLKKNYRSDRGIVNFVNAFIDEHRKKNEILGEEGEIEFSSEVDSSRVLGSSVVEVKGRSEEELAEFVSEFVSGLVEEEIVAKPSDVVLLLPSTREFSRGERKLASYVKEKLEKKGIKVYNPRSKSLVFQDEVAVVMGALCSVFDRQDLKDTVEQKVSFWKEKFSSLASKELKQFVDRAKRKISGSRTVNLLELFYWLLQFEPLKSWKEDYFKSLNLARLSRILSAFSSEVGEIDSFEDWLKEFYETLIYLLSVREFDLQEVEDFPDNVFPIMTFHQSKGLEFPIVIVGGIYDLSGDGDLSEIEKIFGREKSWERSKADAVRKFYVAYSRPIYLLVILNEEKTDLEENKPWKLAAFPGFNVNYFGEKGGG